jgi:hypothetical protein
MAGSKNRPPISVPGKRLSRLFPVILTISQGELYAKGSGSIHKIDGYAQISSTFCIPNTVIQGINQFNYSPRLIV